MAIKCTGCCHSGENFTPVANINQKMAQLQALVPNPLFTSDQTVAFGGKRENGGPTQTV